MLGRTHIASGALAYLALSPALAVTGPELVAGTAVAAYAALLPDLDHPGSTVTRSLGPLHGLSDVIRRSMGGRRGGTHSLVISAILSVALVALVSRFATGALMVGYVTHIAGDCLTPEGCALLWPLSRRKFSLPIVPRTGGRVERWAVAPGLAVAIVAVLAQRYSAEATAWVMWVQAL